MRMRSRAASRAARATAALLLTVSWLSGCEHAEPAPEALPEVVAIPAGAFVRGSDAAEREAAYRLDEQAYRHSRTRESGWYDGEVARRRETTPAFLIMRHPVTNAQYVAFVAATGHRAPDVDPVAWASYGLIHPFSRTRRHAWAGASPPHARGEHPVVLVDIDDARAYARWLSGRSRLRWRLPTEIEWEKAVRGTDGRRFPWGDAFDPSRLNSHDAGPFDTVAVGTYPQGAGPFGLLDGAGQVFEWTATETQPGRFLVKGGSWDDRGCGICRPAARHSRPGALRHILIGFRLVAER